MTGKKPCRTCGAMDRLPDGRCRPCHCRHSRASYKKHRVRANAKQREWHRTHVDWGRERTWRQQGIAFTVRDYNRLSEAQNGKCASCGTLPSGRFKYLAVDHDHDTGRVRGLLCHKCNIIAIEIGQVRHVLAYLERSISSTLSQVS